MEKEGRRIFPTPFGLAVFDPAAALSANLENFKGVPAPGRPIRALIGREEECPVLWEEVRAALFSQVKTFSGPDALGRLYDQMTGIAAAACGPETDLTWMAEHIISRPLLPIVLGGLSGSERRRIERDQDEKLRQVVLESGQDQPRKLEALKRIWVQLRANLTVRRALARRLSPGAPPREDLAQALLPLAKRLGRTRLAYAVTTVLTAITGSPGTIAACTLFELMRRPEWRRRIGEELSAVPIEDFLRGPVRTAPLTHRFVKEALRLWAFPLAATRVAKRDLEIGGCPVARGGAYLLSPFFTHRDPAHWSDADQFDPDRWLGPESDQPPGVYVPFGWAPMACVGATLGLAQLMLFCRLATVEFSIETTSAGRLVSGVNNAPADFRGIIRRRDGSAAEWGPAQAPARRPAAE